MAKTIFGSGAESNFILNMDLKWYRKLCVRLMLALLWITAGAEAVNQLTYRINMHIAESVSGIGIILVFLRSVAALFAVIGVIAVIWAVIGLMRRQVTKQAAVPYLMLLGLIVWAAVSMFHSYDISISFLGQDGRDEGWLALVIYAALFYLGSQLGQPQEQESLLRGVMLYGIVQELWGILQAMPFGEFASQYSMIEPLLWDRMNLPCGMTDSPVTFAALLGMLGAVSVPAELHASEKKTRICAVICRCLALILALKTQTAAGWIAAGGIAILTLGVCGLHRKNAGRRAWLAAGLLLAAGASGALWTYFSPALNDTYNITTEDRKPNGFDLCDGGIVWDDGSYRLSTAGPYSPALARDAAQFDIYDAGSVLKYCRQQGIAAVRIDPLLGVGPDNFYFTQLHRSYDLSGNPNAVDRPYNDCLYIAATRGIPSLILQLWLWIWCLVLAWRRRTRFGGWTGLAAAGGVILYALTVQAGISVLTVTPLFWILLGTLAADEIEKKE